MIAGSLASALHGVARTTLDSDLVADIQPEHIRALVDLLQTDFCISADAIADAIQHRTSFNLIHLASIFKIDVFLPKHGSQFEKNQLANRQTQIVVIEPERPAYVAAAEDKIFAKLAWFRLGGETSERQWQDILGILTVQEGRLDCRYMRKQAELLNVADLLQRVLTAS